MTSHKPGVPNLGRETSFSGVCCNEREAVDDDLYMCSLVRINLLEVFLLGVFPTDLCLYIWIFWANDLVVWFSTYSVEW